MSETTIDGSTALLDELRSPADGRSLDGHPVRRLIALLRSERRDLWVVVAYSIGVGLLTLAVPVAIQSLVNTVAFGALLQPVVVLTLLVLAALGFSALLNAFRVWVVEVIQRRIFVRVTSDVTHRLVRVQPSAFDRLHGPELVNRFFDVVTVQKSASLLLMDGLSLLMQTVVGMLLLAVYHPLLLAFDVFLIVAMAFIVLVLGRGAVKTAIQESKLKYDTAAWLEEVSSHLSTFKTAAGAAFAARRSDHLAGEYLERRREHFRVVMRQVVGALALQALASSALLGIGGFLVIERQLTLGQLVAAELIVTAAVSGFSKLGKKFETYYDLLAAIDKLGELIDLPLENPGVERATPRLGPAALEFREASFAYAGSARVFSNMDLRLEAGDRAAVAGRAGAGKTTLLEIAAGMRALDSGLMLLDGGDSREPAPADLRAQIALVTPNEVFDGTVYENVAVGRAELGRAEVREALRTVGLLEAVLELRTGLETRLTTNGRPLAPSQTARLMLARALCSSPRVLAIDGVLDAIDDPDARGRLADRIFSRDAPWTVLCATRSADIIERCNRVFEIVDGRVKEVAHSVGAENR